MKRWLKLQSMLLGVVAVFLPLQIGYAADDPELEEDPVSANAPAQTAATTGGAAPQEKLSQPSQAELDKNRKALRQELLKDRAVSVQRQAIAKSKAPESAEEKEIRQKLYEESAIERGENVLADREAMREGRIHLDADKLRGLSAWAKGDSNQTMSAQQLARIRKDQESRKSLSSWASGADIQEARRKAREETKQEILRQLHGSKD